MGQTYDTTELIAKAALKLQDLNANGGVMLPEQLDTFLRIMQESQKILGEARVEVVGRGQKVLDRVGLTSEFLRPGIEADTSLYTNPTQRIANLTKPTLGKIELNCFKVSGDMMISWEALRRNIEREDFVDTLIEIAAKRAGFDIERLSVNGVKSPTPTTLLELEDGFLQRVPVSNRINWNSQPLSRKVFGDLIRKIPARFLQNKSEWRFYVSWGIEQAYRELLASRGTALGDIAATEDGQLRAYGIPVVGCDSMPDTGGSDQDEGVILLCHPQNLIYAVEDQLRVVDMFDKWADSLVLFFHASIDIAVEEPMALARATGVRWSSISTTAHGY